MVRLRLNFISFAFATMCSASYGKVLYHGTCTLKSDPIQTSQGLVNLCVNANANVIGAQKSRNEEHSPPPWLFYAEGEASVFFTPYVSLHTKGHSQTLMERDGKEAAKRESKRDVISVQIGNNALSRHRISVGQGHPQVAIDHQQRYAMDYLWSLEKFEAPAVDFAAYTYDNQVDWTVQGTYGRLPDQHLSEKQRLFGAVRIMYDVAALEGTRFVLGGFGDGLLRRSINFGVLNINGRGDETGFEITRQFKLYPYDPDEFRQQIRLSYLSREQDHFRFKFQYEDIFRRARIGSFGGVYDLLKYTEIESQIGYAKREDRAKLSHWFILVRLGVRS